MNRLDGLYVVMPALNEAKTLAAVIEGLQKVVEKVVLVDDGSTDQTADIAQKLGAIVCRNALPTGYDAALARGINEAFARGARAVTTCDADGQHRIEDVVAVSLPVLNDGYDLSWGLRDRYNRMIEAILGGVSWVFFRNRDPFCGLKCYGRSVYSTFGPFPLFLNIGSISLAWQRQARFRTAQCLIHVKARQDEPRFGRAIKASLRLTYAFGLTVIASFLSAPPNSKNREKLC